MFLLYSSAVNNMTKTRNSLHTVEMPWTIADATTIKDIIVEAEGKETVELGYADPNEINVGITTLKILQPFVYSAHSDRADEIFQGAAGLTINGYAGEMSELENTGLEDGGALVKVTLTVTENEQNVQYVYRLGGFASADQRYVKIDDTNAVYLVNTDAVAFLNNATPSYVVDLFANLVNITMVDDLDVSTADDAWNMHIERVEVEGKNKPDDIFYFDGELKDEALSRKLYQVIIGTMNSKLSDDYHYDGDVYCTVKYTLNTEPGEVLIEYLDYSEEYLAVRRDNQTLFLIKRENIDKMIRSLQEFREGTYVPES